MLTSSATIERPTNATSPGGGANTGKRGWTSIAEGEPCRLTTETGTTVTVQAGQLATPERLLVVFDLEGEAIRQGDRLTITGTDAAGGDWTRVVLVLSLRNPRTNSAMRTFVCVDAGPGVA